MCFQRSYRLNWILFLYWNLPWFVCSTQVRWCLRQKTNVSRWSCHLHWSSIWITLFLIPLNALFLDDSLWNRRNRSILRRIRLCDRNFPGKALEFSWPLYFLNLFRQQSNHLCLIYVVKLQNMDLLLLYSNHFGFLKFVCDNVCATRKSKMAI